MQTCRDGQRCNSRCPSKGSRFWPFTERTKISDSWHSGKLEKRLRSRLGQKAGNALLAKLGREMQVSRSRCIPTCYGTRLDTSFAIEGRGYPLAATLSWTQKYTKHGFESLQWMVERFGGVWRLSYPTGFLGEVLPRRRKRCIDSAGETRVGR